MSTHVYELISAEEGRNHGVVDISGSARIIHGAVDIAGSASNSSLRRVAEWQEAADEHFMCWGVDGQRHSYKIMFDTACDRRFTKPNNLLNALIDAGRFSTLDFDCVDCECKNQTIKDWLGSTYVTGDAIIVYARGCPGPDYGVVGEDPVQFIKTRREPNAEMIGRYGDETARNMMDAQKRKKTPPSGHYTGQQLNELLGNPEWVLSEYLSDSISAMVGSHFMRGGM